MTEEEKRLEDARLGKASWRRWGPFLSERQWGTVREDYSSNGEAWEYLPHDHARSRAYRWGEDGLAGVSDDKQHLCFAIALWNGQDSILKERLFGLTSHEGNHGEDVKEYYFYLDNVPSHAYMKYLYKYPQKAFPYKELVDENRKRNRYEFEYELLDTGIFNEDRYYDVFVEYAKTTDEDILIRISIVNRGPEKATIHLLPTLWFRNIWSWQQGQQKPKISVEQENEFLKVVKASYAPLGDRWLYCEPHSSLLFTENETNTLRLFGIPNNSPYVKDGINDYIVQGRKYAVNPNKIGTKVAVHHILEINSGETAVVTLRLSDSSNITDPFSQEFASTFSQRIVEANEFYQRISPFPLSDDMRNVQRQAFAGLLWNKQYYQYNVNRWLKGDSASPKPPESRKSSRNCHWWMLNAHDIFSMPDKWEYPWFAAWDLAFHTLAFATIDPDFAKQQLLQLTKEWYMHPNGQVPAYEWSFDDVNPPVHAWAAMRIYQIEFKLFGTKDKQFLERIFQKLLLNFTWWVNRKDASGRNIFEGGFLGLDNIGAFDRTMGPPAGGTLEQPDGTGWMGMYCLNMLQIALELALDDPIYEDMATKFFEHFVYIADAINGIDERTQGLWNAEKGFYYSVLRTPDHKCIQLIQDTIVGIIPLFAVTTNEPKRTEQFSNYRKRFRWFVEHRPEYFTCIGDLSQYEIDGQHILMSIVSPKKLTRILQKALNEAEFLSPYGIRSVSKYHAEHPSVYSFGGKEFKLDYEPAESTTPLFGGNSNWRGPIWFPLNYLFIESLQKYHYYLGNDYKVEYPTGSGKYVTLWDVTTDITMRLIKIFMKDGNGHRPLYGGIDKFQNDPHWKDYILFHEYFHGDNGAGLGASNQTGWTALVAKLIRQYGEYALAHRPPRLIESEKLGQV